MNSHHASSKLHSVDYEILHATGTLPKSDGFWKRPNMFKKQQQDVFEERYLRFISILGKVQQRQKCRESDNTFTIISVFLTLWISCSFFNFHLKYDALCYFIIQPRFHN